MKILAYPLSINRMYHLLNDLSKTGLGTKLVFWQIFSAVLIGATLANISFVMILINGLN